MEQEISEGRGGIGRLFALKQRIMGVGDVSQLFTGAFILQHRICVRDFTREGVVRFTVGIKDAFLVKAIALSSFNG